MPYVAVRTIGFMTGLCRFMSGFLILGALLAFGCTHSTPLPAAKNLGRVSDYPHEGEIFANVIPNGNFDVDRDEDNVPDGWLPGKTPSPIRDSATGCTTIGEQGRKALWIQGGKDMAGEWSVHLSSIEPGTYYVLSFQLFRKEFENGWYPEIELFGTRHLIHQHATYGKWQPVELLVKAPDDGTETWFRFINRYPCRFWLFNPMLRPYRLAWLKPQPTASGVVLQWLETASNLVLEIELVVGEASEESSLLRFLNVEAQCAYAQWSKENQNSEDSRSANDQDAALGMAWVQLKERTQVSARLVSYFQGQTIAEIRLEDVALGAPRHKNDLPGSLHLVEPFHQLPDGLFPIGIYNVPLNGVEKAIEAGFNTLHLIVPEGKIGPEAVKRISGYPVKWMLDWPGETEAAGDILWAADVLGEKVLCWYIADEPELGSIPPGWLYRTKRQIERRSRKIPTAVAMLRTASLPYYRFCSDWFLVDPYPVPTQPLTWMSDAMDAARDHLGSARTLAVVQAFGGGTYAPNGWARFPTFEEMRVLAFLAIVHGARGIFFYDYTCAASHSDNWRTVGRVVKELMKVKEWVRVRNAGSSINLWVRSPSGWKKERDGKAHYLLKYRDNGAWLLIVVNPEQSSTRIRIEGLATRDAVVTEVVTRTPIVLKRGTLEDELPGLHVAAYEYDPNQGP